MLYYGSMTPDTVPLARLDSFPYRHCLSEVMARPVITASGDMTIGEACADLAGKAISSLLVLDADGFVAGIVTHSDLVAQLARLGAAALELRLAEAMSSPVSSVPVDSYLYLAIARMDRLGLSHLVVVAEDGRPVGMVTARQLLKVRARQALMVGDDVAQAKGAADLAYSHGALAALAQGLRQDGTPASSITAVIAGVIRDITRRAAEIVEDALEADGWGGAPARYALLILGSAGRGESLLTFDQDNALVYDGDTTLDPWFAEFGRRLNDLLDQAGIVLCRGEVMVRNPFWRRSFADWQAELRRWVFQPEMRTLLDVDIFFDMVCVHGDRALAARLRDDAFAIAGQSAFFLQLLTQKVARLDSPLGVFGRFITEDGRMDAKKYGLLPLVSTARARAIQAGIKAASTAERYRALAEMGRLHDDDLASLLQAHEEILTVMLDQQLADLAAGLAASTKIAPAALPRPRRHRLHRALERIDLLRAKVGTTMAV